MTGRPGARCCRTPSTSWAGSPARRRLGMLNLVGWVGAAALAAGLLRALARGGGVRDGPRDGPRPPAGARGAAGRRAPPALPRAAGVPGLRAGWPSPPELRREERQLDLSARAWPDAFGALCSDLAARYPFTGWKGIDWRQRCAAVAPRIVAAAAKRDAKAWYRALRELAWSVPDGHVGLAGDDRGLAEQETGGDFGLRLTDLADGRVVARRVLPEGAAARAGLRYGAEILGWNGRPVGQALAGVPVLWADWPPATAEARRAAQLRFLARAPVGARAAVTFRNRGAARAAAAVLIAAGRPAAGAAADRRGGGGAGPCGARPARRGGAGAGAPPP